MRHFIFALALCASPAFASGYSNHEAITAFADGPCSEFVDTIEGKYVAATFPNGDVDQTMFRVAENGMMWGILLGYDARAGGLHTSEQTTLERLRDGCAENPEQSAKAILDALLVE